jgi:hypothetical protein
MDRNGHSGHNDAEYRLVQFELHPGEGISRASAQQEQQGQGNGKNYYTVEKIDMESAFDDGKIIFKAQQFGKLKKTASDKFPLGLKSGYNLKNERPPGNNKPQDREKQSRYPKN